VIAVAVNHTIVNATSAPLLDCTIDNTCKYGLMNDFQVNNNSTTIHSSVLNVCT